MTDERDLLRAVLAHPAEDTPRLMYADWLDEHGRPNLAEFIRTQCAIAAFDESYYLSFDNCKMCLSSAIPLIRRSAELLHAAWGEELLSWPMVKANPTVCNGWWFRRGFLERVEASAQHWLAHHESLYWHESQTAACPEMKWLVVRGLVDPDTHERLKRDKHKTPCPPWCKGGCHGTGTVPRPFPETAQPIERVTLTTWPDWTMLEDYPRLFAVWTAQPAGPDLARRCLEASWPGVTFELPPAGTTGYSLAGSVWEDMVSQSFGVPAHLVTPP